MSDNGNKEAKTKVKYCSILKEYCIGERCAQYLEMKRMAGGLQQTFGMCCFNAIAQILSEINLKAPAPQQKIEIPKLMRG